MKKSLIILLIGACMAGCTHTNKQTYNVPPSKYIGLEQIGDLCLPDTTHKKALVFCSPYCHGSELRFKEVYNPVLDTLDTNLWRFYFIIVPVDSEDTLDYNKLMQNCSRLGVDTNRAYVWRQQGYREDYNQVLSLFHSTHPLENTISGVPHAILLDEENFIANQRECDFDKRDSCWYAPREFNDFDGEIPDDFQTEDTARYMLVRTTVATPPIKVVEVE